MIYLLRNDKVSSNGSAVRKHGFTVLYFIYRASRICHIIVNRRNGISRNADGNIAYISSARYFYALFTFGIKCTVNFIFGYFARSAGVKLCRDADRVAVKIITHAVYLFIFYFGRKSHDHRVINYNVVNFLFSAKCYNKAKFIFPVFKVKLVAVEIFFHTSVGIKSRTSLRRFYILVNINKIGIIKMRADSISVEHIALRKYKLGNGRILFFTRTKNHYDN